MDKLDKKVVKRPKKKKNKRKSTVLIVLMLVMGLAIMLYPTISNWYNEVTGSHAIQEFKETLEDQSEQEMAEQRAMAEAYNATLRNEGSAVDCPYDYNDIMDFGNGMMGYIEIPIIDVYLPIYHGVSETVLSKGVGHMSKTAFPIGGEGNHSVLTGHTGAPSAHLFTDLNEVKEGDVFYLYVMDETLAYEVDQILVVLPDEVDDILPVSGEDYCTLVTCTPYGINSHRLLVRGHRIEYLEQVEMPEVVEEKDDSIKHITVSAGIAVALIILGTVYYYRRKTLNKKD